MSDYIAERDPKTGRILKAGPAMLDVLAAGRRLNWASPHRRMCQKCRRIAMRDSIHCWQHDPEHKKRRTQIALTSNDPNRILRAAERAHRSTMRKLWYRDPWFNGATIWFAPQIEQEFRFAAANVVLPVETISPVSADTLRWHWRYSRFARNDWVAWEAAVIRVKRREHKIGPPPPDWVHEPPGRYPPGVGSPIVAVTWRELVRRPYHRSGNKGWSAKMKAAAARAVDMGSASAAVSIEQVERFLAQHHRDLREIYQRLGDASSDQAVRNKLARAYAIILRGEAAGYQALHRLFSEVEQASRRW